MTAKNSIIVYLLIIAFGVFVTGCSSASADNFEGTWALQSGTQLCPSDLTFHQDNMLSSTINGVNHYGPIKKIGKHEYAYDSGLVEVALELKREGNELFLKDNGGEECKFIKK